MDDPGRSARAKRIPAVPLSFQPSYLQDSPRGGPPGRLSSLRVLDRSRTRVIFVTAEAGRLGYKTADHSWCNLGQGPAESGPLPAASPARVESVSIDVDDQEYAPERADGEVGA